MRKIILFILLCSPFTIFAQEKTQHKKNVTGLLPSHSKIINNPLWLVNHNIIADSLVNNIDINDSIAVANHAKKLGINKINEINIFPEENNPKITAVYGSRAYKGVVLIFTEQTPPSE